jgi:hypothetical protein
MLNVRYHSLGRAGWQTTVILLLQIISGNSNNTWR